MSEPGTVRDSPWSVVGPLGRTGWRPLAVAVVGLVVVATVSLGLMLFTTRVLHWGLVD